MRINPVNHSLPLQEPLKQLNLWPSRPSHDTVERDRVEIVWVVERRRNASYKKEDFKWDHTRRSKKKKSIPGKQKLCFYREENGLKSQPHVIFMDRNVFVQQFKQIILPAATKAHHWGDQPRKWRKTWSRLESFCSRYDLISVLQPISVLRASTSHNYNKITMEK